MKEKEKLKNKKSTKTRSILISDHNAITLIALIITIIVMLILVGVTVTMALNGGLFNQSKNAAKRTDVEAEREILGSFVTTYLIGTYENAEGNKLGEELTTRDLDNEDNWNVVYTDETEYGTGWNYVQKGTQLEDYGETKYNWVVNYETGEVDYLEEGKYKQLDFEDTVAVVDSLALNIDASNLSSENGWKGIINHGSDGEEDKGVEYDSESKALIFDGVDDYLELTKAGNLGNGFTFEMYMNLDKVRNGVAGQESCGLFCKISDLNATYTDSMRFGFCSSGAVAKFSDTTTWSGPGLKMNTNGYGDINFDTKEYDNWEQQNKYITIVYYRYKDYQSKSTGNTEIDEFMKSIQNDVLVYYIDGVLYGYAGFGSNTYDTFFKTWGRRRYFIFHWSLSLA